MITPFLWDQNLLLWLNFDGPASLDTIMWWVSSKLMWVPLYAVILWIVIRRLGWRSGLMWLGFVAVMVLFADQTCNYAKSNFSKFRPSHYPQIEGLVHIVRDYRGGLYGTISSHAANSMGFAMLAFLTLRWSHLPQLKPLAIGLAIWVALVCYSRIYLGVHYPMDILLGLAVGMFWGYGMFLLFKKVLELKKIAQDKDQ